MAALACTQPEVPSLKSAHAPCCIPCTEQLHCLIVLSCCTYAHAQKHLSCLNVCWLYKGWHPIQHPSLHIRVALALRWCESNLSAPGTTSLKVCAAHCPLPADVADLSLTDCGIEGRDVVATSTLILQRDDDWALLTLPFEFTSYGTAYSNLGVSCNGYLTFGAAGTDACYYTSLWTDPADRADCVSLNSPAVAIFLTGE